MKTQTTYAESTGNKKFNWFTALERRLRDNVRESLVLTAKAKNWTTCACGNQCDIIPRSSEGEPFDSTLSVLGVDFYNAVRWARWRQAINTLHAIEARSAKLISLAREAMVAQTSKQKTLAEIDKERVELKNKLMRLDNEEIVASSRLYSELKRISNDSGVQINSFYNPHL
jgi:hypothetical protein